MNKSVRNFCCFVLIGIMIFTGCSTFTSKDELTSIDYANWDEVLASAKGSEVSFYGWGGSELINNWLSNTLVPYAKENYDINVKVIPMDIDLILNKLVADKTSNNDNGNIDLIWINGENFATAKSNNMLFGPFSQFLPNFAAYIDNSSPEVNFDFGTAVEGYEVPYSKAQLAFIYDEAIMDNPPTSTSALLEFVKTNPYKFTYEAPPGYVGSAFVRNIIYEICDYQIVSALPSTVTKEEVKSIISPAMEYLRELNPYLWQQGTTFPATATQVDTMYIEGQVLMTMAYDPYYVSAMINAGQFAPTSKSFVFDNGTVGNTSYVAIPYNSSNIAGALCLADAILSLEMQASKMSPSMWGALPVIDMNKLTTAELEIFNNIDLGVGALSQEELLSKRIPELPAYLVPLIEEIWLEEVPGK